MLISHPPKNESALCQSTGFIGIFKGFKIGKLFKKL